MSMRCTISPRCTRNAVIANGPRLSFRQVLALAPGMLDAHVNLGSVLQGLGRDDEALACFREGAAFAAGFSLMRSRARPAGWSATAKVEEACARLVPLVETARDNP
jgi:hypothetical protein